MTTRPTGQERRHMLGKLETILKSQESMMEQFLFQQKIIASLAEDLRPSTEDNDA